MKETLDCLPCYLKQIMNTFNQIEIPEDQAKAVMRQVLPLISSLNPDGTPAENSSYILHEVYRLIGDHDPFKRAKQESNQLALALLGKLREKVRQSPDPLYCALQIAVAGNIIDMGIIENDDIDVEESLEQALHTSFAKDEYLRFKEILTQLDKTARILIIGDNSGEIAFDRLLAEQLVALGFNVVYAVKGGAIINDATLEDAEQVSMGEVAQVISTGSNFLGVVAGQASPSFLEILDQSPLVISKGQANYESLESTAEAGNKTFFLLKAKCEVIARHLNVNIGELVFCQS